MPGRKRDFQRLAADRIAAAVVEFVAEHHLARAAGAGLDPTALVAQADGAADDLPPPRRLLLDDARRPQRLDERQAGAVAAGHFRPIDPHFAVVDLQAGQGRHDVLDHLHAGLAAAERRSPRRFDAMVDRGGDPRAARQVGADEDDARVGRRGAELDADVVVRSSSPLPAIVGRGGYRSLLSCSFHPRDARHP